VEADTFDVDAVPEGTLVSSRHAVPLDAGERGAGSGASLSGGERIRLGTSKQGFRNDTVKGPRGRQVGSSKSGAKPGLFVTWLTPKLDSPKITDVSDRSTDEARGCPP
jgi:hypothetical protein